MKKMFLLSALVVAFVGSSSLVVVKAMNQKAPETFVEVKEMNGTVVSVDNFRRKVSDSTAWNTGAMVKMDDGSMKCAFLKQGVTVTLSWENITYTSNGASADYEGWMLVK